MTAPDNLGSAEEFEPSDIGPRPPEFTDESLALRFAARHHDLLRFVSAWGKWFVWDGVRWEIDDTLKSIDLARVICREASSECNKARTASAVASAKTVRAIETLARADRRLAATVDQWDADPWTLNTPSGSFDLRSGKRRDHRQTDYCTKATAVAPGGDCPQWLTFLGRITGGSAPLTLFLQRIGGYFLTGATHEHALFFGHGTGANGKSVFVNTISAVLGDYATTAPMETFISSTNDRHPTELAGLRGARLVTAVETEQGRRWNESRIKALTGGDRIAARFMRQDFFEFTPQFKLLIAGNHRPELRGVDEAIRRRMNLVPFAVTIPQAERDETLAEKLKAEWPGILQWMLDGCADWQRQGLAQPEIVKAATADYLAAEDAMAQWLAEKCTMKTGRFATVPELFASWKRWAEGAGEFVGSQKRFSQAMQSRGMPSQRQGGTGKAIINGLFVNLEYEADEAAQSGL